ncbi:MAG: hypothetical protein EOO88_43460, partial [Pedobacter sp.]
MKTSIITLSLCLLFTICKAQNSNPVSERTPVFDGYGRPISYGVSQLRSKIVLLLEADKQTKSIRPFNQIPNDPLGNVVFLDGTKEVKLTTRVKVDSLKFYRYSVIENDTNVLVSDGELTIASAAPMGYLTMQLRLPEVTDKKLTIKIHRLPEADKVTTLIIYNKPFERIKILERQLISEDLGSKSPRKLLPFGENDNIYLDKNTKGIILSVKKTDLDFAYAVYVLQHVDRKRQSVKFTYVPNSNWNYNTSSGNPLIFIDKTHFTDLGDYEIKIIPDPNISGFRKDLDNTAHVINSRGQMIFRVSSTPGTFSIREMAIIAALILMAITCVASVIITFNKRKNRKKVVQAELITETIKGELDQIRSQLNPHFVYNSLSGIQNLMNQNETEKANAYLNKFARLTRNILDDQELISIQEEQNLLSDYLAMESLRFKFTYEINIIGDTNFPNTEIPSMLLQPFVENAVKHNMATLQDKGELLVELKADQNNVVLSVKDNGKGFDTQELHEGLGLKLCKKRIDLLNQLYE